MTEKRLEFKALRISVQASSLNTASTKKESVQQISIVHKTKSDRLKAKLQGYASCCTVVQDVETATYN